MMLNKIGIMKKIIFFILLLVGFSACSSREKKNQNELKIRLTNVSPYDYKNIIVNTSSGDVKFDDLKSGETSDYHSFKIAYSYAYVKLDIDGRTYVIQPMDYVGETPLEVGSYTYQIDANESQKQHQKLTLTLVKD